MTRLAVLFLLAGKAVHNPGVPRRILLVDDDIVEISAVKRALLKAGLSATLATNCTDALSAIEETAPDAVLLSPTCENGGGAALGRRLSSQPATRDIPMVLLGAGVDGIAAEQVPRPVETAALERALRAALERRMERVEAPALRAPELELDAERLRHESQAAELERAAAEHEAVLELRHVEDDAREPSLACGDEQPSARPAAGEVEGLPPEEAMGRPPATPEERAPADEPAVAFEARMKAHAEAPGVTPPGSIDSLRIGEKLEQVRHEDYFAILGLDRGCTRHEVLEASERLLSLLHAERFPSIAPGLAEDLEEVRRVLGEARDVLSDDALRAEYRANLGD